MLTLGIETATDHSSLVLREGDAELAAWREVTHQDLLQRLAGEVGRVLAQGRRRFEQLELVAVGLGPGSFTSLRVGLATAKGLCLAHGVPLVGVPSLAAMTWQVRARFPGVVCPLLDARRGEVYGGLFQVEGEAVTRVAEEFVATPASLGERVAALGAPVVVLGQMDLAPVEEIAAALPGTATLVRDEVIVPEAGAVAVLGERQFAHRGGDDAGDLHPIYVRKSYAEEKFDLDLGLR